MIKLTVSYPSGEGTTFDHAEVDKGIDGPNYPRLSHADRPRHGGGATTPMFVAARGRWRHDNR